MPRPWRCLDVILAVVLICGGVLVDAATPPSAAEPAARTNWSATTSTCMSFFDLPERDVKQALLNAGLNGAVRELLSEVLHDPHGQGVPTLPQDALVRQVRTLLHLQGTPAFDAGEDFGQACVHLQVSVTADDMALFQSTKIAGRRVCATPEEAPSVQQLASTKATLDALYTYNPALRSIPPARVLPLLRHVDLTGGVHGASYCLAATGVVYPIEVRVLAGNLQPPPDCYHVATITAADVHQQHWYGVRAGTAGWVHHGISGTAGPA